VDCLDSGGVWTELGMARGRSAASGGGGEVNVRSATADCPAQESGLGLVRKPLELNVFKSQKTGHEGAAQSQVFQPWGGIDGCAAALVPFQTLHP
jgi:hypothetical protein